MINVFNIERFATHDGEGIRTVIFLKGCSLYCPWCANPESWKKEPQLLYDKKKCIKCYQCEKVCKSGAIYFKNDIFHYDTSSNDLCEESTEVCPTGALEIVGKRMTNDEILKIVLKDIDYYKNSGGGVTISGGEPFFQFPEMLSLLKNLKKNGLHTAVETTGHYEKYMIKEAEPYIDTFLFDIKQLDGSLLKRVVGANKDQIMENFMYLVNICPNKIVMRVPIIPGFNYTHVFINKVLKLAKESNIREVNLLPYHTLGKNKWDRLLKNYYSNQKMLNKSELGKYKDIGEKMDLNIKIGG